MRRVQRLSSDQIADLIGAEPLQHPEHLFLVNQMHAELAREEGEAAGRFWAVRGRAGIEIAAFFGGSRVLVVGPGPAAAAVALRRTALGEERGFRILIGPREPAAALLDALRPKVRVELCRSQPFLRVDDAARLGEPCPCRVAARQDADWLVRASLRLNEEDLGIPAHSVDEKLLRARIGRRLASGDTWIAGAGGRPACKLEVGNQGPAGALIEGVYTEPRHRSHGLARRLVAAVGRRLLARYPCVGLHVGRGNTPALRAYLAAGFDEVADLELALLAWR